MPAPRLLDILRQNALINAMHGDTSQIIGQKINDPAALLLGRGRAQSSAATNMWYIASGRMAEQALPLGAQCAGSAVYALFPLVLLLVMLTSGRTTGMALKAYAVAFIWIQLWPPIYAIFNYMGILASAKDLAAAADLGGGLRGMALQTAAGIYTNAISIRRSSATWWCPSRHRLVCAEGAGTSRPGGVQRSGRIAIRHRLDRATSGGREHESRQSRVRSGAIGTQPQFRLHAQLQRRHGASYENVTDPRSYRRENRLGSNALNIADVQDISLATSEVPPASRPARPRNRSEADTALSAALNEVLSNTASSGVSTASGHLLSTGKTATSATQAQTLRQVSQQLASDLGIKDTSVCPVRDRTKSRCWCGLGKRQVERPASH